MIKYLFLFAALIAVSASCKKEKNKPVCRISRLITPTGKQIRITYNAEGKYAKIEDTESNETHTSVYESNLIVVTTVTTGSIIPKARKFLHLNGSGMIDILRWEFYNSAGTTVLSSLETEYQYNGLQLMKTMGIDSFYSTNSVSTLTVDYTWENDNLIKYSSATFLGTHGYYSDELFQQGDLQSIREIRWGVDINLHTKNKNLTKFDGGSPVIYDFDEEGKIKAVSGENAIRYLVEYECN